MNAGNRPLVGIVGDGQLGRMLALAARDLNIETVVFGKPDSPAGQVTSIIEGDFRDAEQVARFCANGSTAVVTTEFEDASPEGLLAIQASGTPVWPDPRVTAQIKDKYRQKVVLETAGVPMGRFLSATSAADVLRFAEEVGFPVVLKARHGSYDGTGNVVINGPDEVQAAYDDLTNRKGAVYVEAHVDFAYEAAIIFARGVSGEVQFYDPVVTHQADGVCSYVEYRPGLIRSSVQRRAKSLASRVIQRLQPFGVTAIEFFVLPDGMVLFNEMAPRVHNSGHLTIEAAATSQFTNHLLAILDRPLGETDMVEAAMVNILGRSEEEQVIEVLPSGLQLARDAGAHVHWYGKAKTRKGRKLGHLTVVGPDPLPQAQALREIIEI